LYEREKNATSAPETEKEITIKIRRRKTRIVVACVLISAG
jgi:hypothetical protein